MDSDQGVQKLMTYWITGHSNALLWVNALQQAQGRPPLFCQPGKLALTPEQDVKILRDYISEHPADGDEPAGMAIMDAFIATFPCKP